MWSQSRCSRVLSDRVGVREQAPGSYEYEKEVTRGPSGGGRDDPAGSIAARAASHRRCHGARHGRTPAPAGKYLPGQRQQNALETCARSMWRRRVRSTRGVMEREFSRGPPRWSIASRTGLALRTQRTSRSLRRRSAGQKDVHGRSPAVSHPRGPVRRRPERLPGPENSPSSHSRCPRLAPDLRVDEPGRGTQHQPGTDQGPRPSSGRGRHPSQEEDRHPGHEETLAPVQVTESAPGAGARPKAGEYPAHDPLDVGPGGRDGLAHARDRDVQDGPVDQGRGARGQAHQQCRARGLHARINAQREKMRPPRVPADEVPLRRVRP